MKTTIIISILLILLTTATAAQAITISGWSHPDYIQADISATYSAGDSTLLLTVTNTSPATSAFLRGLLFSAPDVTLNLRNVSYYAQSVLTNPTDVTDNWSVGTPESSILNAEPIKYHEGITTALFTGRNFDGGNPNLGLETGWTATFLFNVEGQINQPLGEFIARFQSINYLGITGSDSDFAHAAPTPVPGAVWLLGAGLIGLTGLRRRIRT
ncbi:PEP-CTERM sorting domain-containing protein [Maridesulfovibrio sp. FT414]|uniref:PEP-CTERM sorting domain-containing protein n=1 Tax=Maridesulfovibrio sp. FT414 TaxID=2979469 RepID=UPI003D803B46